MGLDLAAITNIVQSVGVVGLLIFALFSRYKGWWVDGPTYQKVVSERDGLLTMAFRESGVHERTVGILDRVVRNDAPGAPGG